MTPHHSRPRFVSKTVRYGRALARWIKAGRPSRSSEEICGIYTTHCRECDRFDEGRCGECGCNVNLQTMPMLNKIAMATEHCPLEKW